MSEKAADRAPSDFAPLSGPVDRGAVRAYESDNGFAPTDGRSGGFGVVVGVVLGGVAAFVIALPLALVVMLASPVLEQLGVDMSSDRVFQIAFLGAATLIACLAWFIVKDRRRAGEERYRVSRFAAANGLEFVPRIADPESPGMIFGIGGDRVASEVVRLTRPRPVEIANYRYVQKTAKTHETFSWSYVEITLERRLPHIVLDSRRNNSPALGSNLPVPLATAQRLSLEGDFDRYFDLYCPEGYEADALYLFTPDVMARFVDTVAEFDIEIVDDRLYLYSHGSRPLSGTDPATWEWVFATIDVLDAKLERWERWRDDRLAEPDDGVSASTANPTPGIPRGVAPQGRRLKHRIPVLAVLPLVVMVGIWFVIPLLESLTGGD
ncbi:DUF3137 domain-containing protein [Agromyces sp. S2-1-8]|uniref:DUF3137 domain-containing protein n=1 Tax=Agromyces sp. S2-1-8 TaxID=2897180 RepID=UPI001E3935DD|nr:DUF3137 domain-containing protein [Agromyces sp. S2-1-8]MCD5345924.1 DUF3137 domain-containing protein [Agromyces sp. S2-1-8]